MAYRATKAARDLFQRFKTTGKNESLILPGYVPTVQLVLDAIVLGLIIGAVVLALALSYTLAIAPLLIAFVLWFFRETFAQDDHALVRIYGPMGRLRYLFEEQFRDKYLQYFNETNTDGRPIPRIVRNYVYQKAHAVKSITSFGTELDTFDGDTTTGCRILHRNFPGEVSESGYEVVVGGKRKGVRPFIIKSTINISAMSFGSINNRSAEAISLGAAGIAYVNTGEGGYGPHGVGKGDNVFQIGTGKFGVGRIEHAHDGTPMRVLDDQLLVQLVKENDNIGMIQVKLSQGAKPGLGGHLPGDKVTEAIATVRKVPIGQTVISPPQHTETMGKTPKESVKNLMAFIEHIRNLTGLPVGIKLCVGQLSELDLLVEAMVATKTGPDAIQLDGADGGTGAGENIFVNYVGYGSAIETIAYLDQKLKRAGIRDQVVLTASGKIFTPAHAALAFAFGADSIDTARGAMLALGCIQSLKCHTNACPTGIATNNPWRVHGINVPEKATRIHNYLTGFHADMLRLAHVAGHSDPRDIGPETLRFITGESQVAQHFAKDPNGFDMPLQKFWKGITGG